MPELVGMIFPRMGNRKGAQEPGAFRAAGAVGIGSQGMARLQSKAMQNPPPHHLEAPGRGPGGLQATSYSLRAGNSASFYQTPHQSFYISLPSAGSAQTLHPLPGSRTPCASCSAPVTCGGTRGCRGGGGGRG